MNGALTRHLAVWLIGGMCLLPATAAAGTTEPDATLSLGSGAEQAGAGYLWTRGTLRYRGKVYRFRVEGLGTTYLDAPVSAVGDVYRLKTLRHLNGTYSEIEVDAALARQGTRAAMRNEHGVIIALRSQTEGLVFDISLIGVSIRLQGKPARAR